MNILPDEQAREVQQAIVDFLGGESTVARVREAEKTASRIDAALWRNFADLGWLGLCLPEADGGQGLPLSYLGYLFEELGRYMAPLPAHATLVPLQIIARHGDTAQRRLIARVLQGGLILAHAVQEQDGRWDSDAIQLRARVEGGEIVLSGAKYFVDQAANAGKCLVAARLDDGDVVAILVDMAAPGVAVRRLSPMAKDDQSIVEFHDVRVPPSSRIGGAQAIEDMMDLSSVLLAAQMQGAARQAMETAVAYVNQREAFGQPIGAFQAIQHMAADMVNTLDGTQLLVREALWRMSEGLPGTIEVSQAKSFASERCLMVCRCTQQMHGGMGFIAECDINLWYRRVAAWGLRGGTTHEHRRRIAASLLDVPGHVRLGMPQQAAGRIAAEDARARAGETAI